MSAVATEVLRAALAEAGLLLEVRGAPPVTIDAITDDSRQVRAGACFVAVRGSERDGHAYLDAAVGAGASLAIVEDAERTALPRFVVRDGRRAAAVAAAAFHGRPADALRLVAVTGTSGKTTTVGMLRHLLDDPASRSASIGTLGVLLGSAGAEVPGGSGLTTPGPIELQRVLRTLVDARVGTVAMEVSSHSLDQRRVEGVRFAAGVFTNLSRDHLDYHGTMEAYLEAKARLVSHLSSGGVAVVNADDPAWQGLPPAPRVVRFGLDARDVDVRASDVRYSPAGSRWTLHLGDWRGEVTLPLIGDFNVLNALGAAAAAWTLGVAPERIARGISTMPQVPGRLERILDAPAVLRDYAHKPDALERALGAVRPFTDQRLIVVFGCGGDRDRGKRPIMGEIAERLADLAIITSDNPRTEDPDAIIDEVESGMHGTSHERITDRREAIARALDLAGEGDVVVLAGKGHETYQIRGTTKLPFDEREVVAALIAERSPGGAPGTDGAPEGASAAGVGRAAR